MATGGTGRKSGYSDHAQDKDPKKRMDPDAPDHVSSDPPDNPDGLGDVPVITKDGIIPRPDQTPATANAEDRTDLAPQQPDGMPGHFGIDVKQVDTSGGGDTDSGEHRKRRDG